MDDFLGTHDLHPLAASDLGRAARPRSAFVSPPTPDPANGHATRSLVAMMAPELKRSVRLSRGLYGRPP